MSKTLGNVVDPIGTMQEFGTDALRFTLALGTAGQVCYFKNKMVNMIEDCHKSLQFVATFLCNEPITSQVLLS